MSVNRKVTVPVGVIVVFLPVFLAVLLPAAPSLTLWSLSLPRAGSAPSYAPDPELPP